MKYFTAEIKAEIFIPSSVSLKDKRRVLLSIKDRLKRMNVSYCEAGFQELHQRSGLVIVFAAAEIKLIDNIVSKIFELFENLGSSHGFEIIRFEKEIL